MKIMERGQVTIPKKYREQYGISQNTEIDFIPKEEGLMIVKKNLRETTFREAYGLLKKNTSTDAYIEKVRGR